jgi:hypothetical protein
MTSLIDPRHLGFVLDDVLKADRLLALPAFAEHDRAGTRAMLETAAADHIARGAAPHREMTDVMFG